MTHSLPFAASQHLLDPIKSEIYTCCHNPNCPRPLHAGSAASGGGGGAAKASALTRTKAGTFCKHCRARVLVLLHYSKYTDCSCFYCEVSRRRPRPRPPPPPRPPLPPPGPIRHLGTTLVARFAVLPTKGRAFLVSMTMTPARALIQMPRFNLIPSTLLTQKPATRR